MQFQRLRLVGFKSFVDPAEVHIESGLTGVVGPNGCGKSNVLESLRWVMGANSAKAMRGQGMDDVIFAGAAGRPPRSHAEVSLTIDNAARRAPQPFTDSPVLEVSAREPGEGWAALAAQRESARALGVEGLMLKHRNSVYGTGRQKRGDGQGLLAWWKWKIDPFSVDAVLIYAQRGHGRRASLYSDYTFAVWDGPPESSQRALVPFAKAYSGLTDEEMRQVDSIVRKTTVEKFGPVSSVKPSLVFELGFEGIALSRRHKSGIAVRFPRMLRWRQDKTVDEADSLATLQDLLA